MKTKFEIKKTINNRERESISHEIDHVKEFPTGTIAWKSSGTIKTRSLIATWRTLSDYTPMEQFPLDFYVTRGRSLQEQMRALVGRFVDARQISSFADLVAWGYEPTSKQRRAIEKRMTRKQNALTFRDAFVDKFVSDKFGEATTHWRKLDDRVRRGVGNPCPLVLIGLPAEVVTFDEGKSALDEVLKDDNSEEE